MLAALMGDNHVCPMVTPGVPPVPHVGGPVMGTAVTVMITNKPAATVGDTGVCTGPPDSVAMGAMTVMFANKPAAKVTSQCAHGGVIVGPGAPTVLIGG